MKKLCLILAIALMSSVRLGGGQAYAVSGDYGCKTPNKLTGEGMGPLIEDPMEFLRSHVKQTHTIKNFKTLKSQDFNDGYFVAGEIIDRTTNKSYGIGVWFAPEWYAMSGPALKYSTLMSFKIGRSTWADSGNGYKVKKDVTKKSHGYKEILNCFS